MAGELLREQFEACKEIDINVPIYLSAGVDDLAAGEHPEWLITSVEGETQKLIDYPDGSGYRKLCFNSPYLDYLCEQIKEAVRMFPTCDGIFLDIISLRECHCDACKRVMAEKGWDISNPTDRHKASVHGLYRYYEMTTAAAKVDDPEMPIFHNSGGFIRGQRDLLKFFSHIEMESLPTGGWGYDHFPILAKYFVNLPLDYLGMTGKFHTLWGEFGGYKHPNALQYECAAMLAYGAKCSVGDQLHPEGEINQSTYEIIGSAYRQVELKEPWCENVSSVAEIGLLSTASLIEGVKDVWDVNEDADVGAARLLLEGHFLFDVIDTEMDFSKYKILLLPDEIRINPILKEKLDNYLASGGKLFMTGQSGLWENRDEFAFDIGATCEGPSRYKPNFILPIESVRPDFIHDPIVMYTRSQLIKVTEGKSLGDVYDPYFNRSNEHYCSHQHTPSKPTPSGYNCGVLHGQIMYLAHDICKLYLGTGAVAYKEYFIKALRMLLGKPMLEITMPSTGRISLMHQPEHNRSVLHLLYAPLLYRGGKMDKYGGVISTPTNSVEVIEELLPLNEVKVKLRPDFKVKSINLQPQNQPVEWQEVDDAIEFVIDQFICHQMVVLE